MCKTVFAILATTALLSTGMIATRVEAMTPSPLGARPIRTSFSKPPLSVAPAAACTVRPRSAGRYGTAGVVAGTPGMDADPVGRDKGEDARPTDGDGEAGGTRQV